MLLVGSLNVAIALAGSPGVLENLIRYFDKQFFHRIFLKCYVRSFQPLKRHKAILGKIALRNQLACYSSLFLTKITITKNTSGVMRKSALDCCFMARLFSIVLHVLKTYFFSINGPKSSLSIEIHGQ